MQGLQFAFAFFDLIRWGRHVEHLSHFKFCCAFALLQFEHMSDWYIFADLKFAFAEACFELEAHCHHSAVCDLLGIASTEQTHLSKPAFLKFELFGSESFGPNEARTHPERTPKASQANPEQILNGPRKDPG